MSTSHAVRHTSTQGPVLRVRGVTKAYGRHTVVRDVDFELRPGEVHVVTGPNGAGKSTLLKILAGVVSPQAGTLELHGQTREFVGPAQARAAGIATVHQELSLVAELSILDNIMLAREPFWLGRRARKEAALSVQKRLTEVGLEVDVDRLVGQLPLAQQQRIELVRGLYDGAQIFLLDEPSSALPRADVIHLYQQINQLRAGGCAVLLISHKLDEILELGDRVSVMRDGEIVYSSKIATGTANTADDQLRREIVAAMVGQTSPENGPEPSAGPACTRPLLRLVAANVRTSPRVGPVDLELAPGDIVGLAGLQGSGVQTLLHALAGAGPGLEARAFTLDGRALTIKTPRQALAAGIVLLTCDRKTAGLVGTLGSLDNTMLSALERFTTLGFVHRQQARAAAGQLLKQANLVAADLDAPVTTLSGGNQQKVYLARCLLAKPRLLLVDDPARGVDLAARQDLFRLIHSHAQAGNCVLWSACELSELTANCQRILAFHRGRVVGCFSRPFDQKAIVAATLTGVPQATASVAVATTQEST